MTTIHVSLIWPGCAQGTYTLKVKGSFLAVLRWGNQREPLCDWSPFAYVPIDPAGNGSFFFSGMRGIPSEASHVWARCYSADFSSFEDASSPIEERFLTSDAPGERAQRFSVLTDLHLAAKPWKIRQAFRAAQSDTIFLLGDSTNDGLSQQFAAFEACMEETIPDHVVFPVTGNHDVLHPSRTGAEDGCKNYEIFQNQLLKKAEARGYSIAYAPDHRAYSVQIGDLDVIALQCVTSGRKFLFPDGIQIDWLEAHLSAASASRHIILCHAPLLKHNPNRNDGVPYLDKNTRLQNLLDQTGRIIFLNGHTHVSPNVLTGNAKYDREHQNLYIDCASLVSTDTSNETGLMAPDWKDGCITELSIAEDTIEIRMRSVSSGVTFPRGYYRFALPQAKDR